MEYLVNTSAIILRSADFAFMMNPNGPMKDRYIGIFSIIIYFTDTRITPKPRKPVGASCPQHFAIQKSNPTFEDKRNSQNNKFKSLSLFSHR